MSVRNSRKEYAIQRISRYTDPNGLTQVWNDSDTVVGTDSRVTGPNWADHALRIAQGRNATTSLVGQRRSLPKRVPAYYQAKSPAGHLYEGFGFANIPVSMPPSTALPLSKAGARAVQNFNKAYLQKAQAWQGGVFLGELREAVQFVRNPVKKLYSTTDTFADNLLRLKRQMFHRNPAERWRWYRRNLSDLWLAYAFAARPLASDANDASKALALLLSRRTHDIVRVDGSGDDSVQNSSQYLTAGWTGINNFLRYHRHDVLHSRVTIRGGLRSSPPAGVRAPEHLGLGLFDVVPTAWELLPWSFLVDYFTNVGDCLSALRLRHVDWAWLNRTVRNRRVVQSSDLITGKVNPADLTRSVSGGAVTSQTTYVDRATASVDVFSMNRLMFEVPGMDSLKWLNIAALGSKFRMSRPRA